MSVPFTADEFLAVFRRYNDAVWPAQWALLVVGLAVVWFALRRRHGGRLAMALLAALWVWMGVVYQLVFFRSINPAATVFGAAFIGQGILFSWLAVRPEPAGFRVKRDLAGVAGSLIVAYTFLGYPILGFFLGHRYPAAPTFGVPCPTTILTLGVLLWASPQLPWWTLVVPLLWTLVGASAAAQFGMREDWGLLAAGIAFLVILLRERLSTRWGIGRGSAEPAVMVRGEV